jgi:hypothetical protein
VAMTSSAVRLKAAIATVRLKADTTLSGQNTRTLPITDSVNHRGGDVAGPGEGF